ncbi:unnamed protein product [Didymodactylos carnosus]|uniref:Uncharacterized protein n=1 Tax=Didymodactylos carnosus TaxID=1234261 RepID=A0A813QCM6_9BILA|nr:unnamed protein product [Didymodactylos carnosus]CAF3546152.1 unnamed protein product [Didymodactylos carnosus]
MINFDETLTNSHLVSLEEVRYTIPATHVYQQRRNIVIPNYSTPPTTQYASLECVPQSSSISAKSAAASTICTGNNSKNNHTTWPATSTQQNDYERDNQTIENKPLYNGASIAIKSYHKQIHQFCTDLKLDNDQITKLLQLISYALPHDHHLALTSQKLFELVQDKIRCPNCCYEINTGGIINDPVNRQPFVAVQNNPSSTSAIQNAIQNDLNETLQSQIDYIQEPYADTIEQNKKFKSSIIFEPVGHDQISKYFEVNQFFHLVNGSLPNVNSHNVEDVSHLDPTTPLTTSDAFKIAVATSVRPFQDAVKELYSLIGLQNEKLERNLRYTQHLPGQMNNAVTSVNNFLRLTSKLTSGNKIDDNDPNVILIINDIDLKDAQVTNSFTGTGRNCVRHVYGPDASGHSLKQGEFEIIIEAIAYLHKVSFADVWSKATIIKESLLQMKYDNKKHTATSSTIDTSRSKRGKSRQSKQATASSRDISSINSVQELITTALPIAQTIEQQSS